MTNKDITINEAQKQVDNWIKTYGVRYFSELEENVFVSRIKPQGIKP